MSEVSGGLPLITDTQGYAWHEPSVELVAAPLWRPSGKNGSSRCTLDRHFAATPRRRLFDSRGEPGGEGWFVELPCDNTSKRRLIAGTKRRMWPQGEATWNWGTTGVVGSRFRWG